ncbi:MAG: glycosyltransferase family 4 protein [Candidatus Omnitrophica bacterium]|nr:glycosyltransferase family 4 protein [Candidatus Omnitrophota bacterium]
MPASFSILHVVASLQGGAAQQIFHLSRALRERGHFVAVASPGDDPSLQKRFQSAGVSFYEAPLDSPFPAEAVLKLKTILESRHWTHMHVHGHRAAMLGRAAACLMRNAPPVVYTVHGYHPPYYSNRFSQKIVNGVEALLLPWTRAYIAVSERTRIDLLAALPRAKGRCAVIENAIAHPPIPDDDRIRLSRRVREQWGIPPEAFVVGTVGRLQWQKSISRLVYAFRRICDHYEDAFLLIVGDGPKRSFLEHLAGSLGVGEKCIFTGHQNDPMPFYPAMDLFVLSSLWEGLPLTILESWTAHTPAAATKAPGTEDLIEDGVTGFLAENSIEGIAQVIQRVRSQVDLIPQIVRNAENELTRRYALEQMAAQTEQIYRQTFVEAAPGL